MGAPYRNPGETQQRAPYGVVMGIPSNFRLRTSPHCRRSFFFEGFPNCLALRRGVKLGLKPWAVRNSRDQRIGIRSRFAFADRNLCSTSRSAAECLQASAPFERRPLLPSRPPAGQKNMPSDRSRVQGSFQRARGHLRPGRFRSRLRSVPLLPSAGEDFQGVTTLSKGQS